MKSTCFVMLSSFLDNVTPLGGLMPCFLIQHTLGYAHDFTSLVDVPFIRGMSLGVESSSSDAGFWITLSFPLMIPGT